MKKIIYIFEDYRDEAEDDEKTVFTDVKEAESHYKALIKAGYKVFNFGSERVIFPLERQGEKIVTYGVYTDYHLPPLT